MQDHGLFQAICRTNRLDGDDKDFGYIVDYKDLFKKVENAIAVYTSELDHSAGGADPEVLLKDRLKQGKERLDNALEAIALICDPCRLRKANCSSSLLLRQHRGARRLKTCEPRRVALYKAAAALVRAYANIADDLSRRATRGTGSPNQARRGQLRQAAGIVRQASGETLDLKTYEADMRHLIDTYIEAGEPRKISPFDDIPLWT